MENPLASKSPTSGAIQPDRDLARAVMTATDWDARYAVTKHQPASIRATRVELERTATVSLRHHEPKLDGSLCATIKGYLSTIGAKIRPDLSPDQAMSWVNAMVIALSDLPPNVAHKATERALHVPFQFPSEVEVKLREFADEHMERMATAIRRLKAMEDEINRAIHGKPQLTDERPVHGPVIETAEVRRMLSMGGTPAAVVSLGVKLGYITEDQLPADMELPDPFAIPDTPKEGN